jgi:hypothetical protein
MGRILSKNTRDAHVTVDRARLTVFRLKIAVARGLLIRRGLALLLEVSMRWMALGVAAGGVIVACGGKMDDPCGAYLDAVNAHADKCGEDRVASGPSGRDMYTSLCVAAASAPGATNMDQQIDACTKAINDDQRCDITIVECIMHGSRPDGAPCATASQCAGGSCMMTGATVSATSEQQCGTCASYVQAGGVCDATHTCDPTSSLCTILNMDGSGVCGAFVKEGGDCDGEDSGPCGPALKCGDDGTCTKRPQKGDDCAQLDACAEPWRCIDGTCADGAGEGDACPKGFECGANLGCNTTTHECEKLFSAPVGGACDVYVGCDGGASCTNGVCVLPKKIGDACTVGKYECEPFAATCIDGTCRAPSFDVCN